MELLSKIPEIFIEFIIVVLFSLFIGLEQRRQENQKGESSIQFGTDRTFTFIGVLGFILYILEPHYFTLFILGAVILGSFFGIYYSKKIQEYKAFGITKILVGLITYFLAPVVITQPKWLSILIVVSVLILVESKHYFITFAGKFSHNEFVTLAKFLIIAGVVLPILPDTPLSDLFKVSPYQIWLALVVVAGISYFSYLLQKFVFVKSGIVVSGMLGGLYSSTATTVILSRKCNENNSTGRSYAASILIANSMMYLRVFLLMMLFNFSLAAFSFPYFIILFLILFSIGIGLYLTRSKSEKTVIPVASGKNPLELKVAVIFSALFLIFSFLTNYTIKVYGESGLNILSYIVGFADIDPFLLNLFQGKYQIDNGFILKAAFQAIVSNNILKIIATIVLADKLTKKIVFAGLGFITIVNIIIIFLL